MAVFEEDLKKIPTGSSVNGSSLAQKIPAILDIYINCTGMPSKATPPDNLNVMHYR